MKIRDKKIVAAVRENDWVAVKMLLDAGADPDAEGPFGALIFLALLLSHITVARLLVEAGADIAITDDTGRTPFHWAAKTGDQDLVRTMMESEADLLAVDRDGDTPMDVLCDHGYDQVLDMIKQRFPREYDRWAARSGK